MDMTMLRARGATAAAALMAATLLLPAGDALAAPTKVEPGFNLFSAEQDVEIGRQSAAEAERQLPILNDRQVQTYIDSMTRRLAAYAPGPEFPYQGKVVNANDINAFALPGGFLYVNRGLINTARTEGELAGVIAHEIAHIALRHGTHNASKAYAAQAGLGVLGGLLGRGQGRTTQSIINVVGGLGLNAVFLKYSRDAETQADIVGAQIMAQAGYDPMGMVSLFELLQSQGGGGSIEFLSDHPAPENRAARIRQEAAQIGAPTRTAGSSAAFQDAQRRLGGMASTASGPVRRMDSSARRSEYPSRVGRVDVAPPSGRFQEFRQRDDFFRIEVPEGWRGYESDNGYGVTLVPEGGVVEASGGQQSIVYGAIVNHYDPFEAGTAGGYPDLRQATDDLIDQIRRTNSHLDRASRALRTTIDGQPALTTTLSGISPTTGEEERVRVVTRELSDGHVVYALFIVPGRDAALYDRTFDRMMDSLNINERVIHR